MFHVPRNPDKKGFIKIGDIWECRKCGYHYNEIYNSYSHPLDERLREHEKIHENKNLEELLRSV